MELVVFCVLSFVSIASGVLMISLKNAVHSAFCLMLVFFCVAGIYLQLGAELIAGLQIFLYAGAIMVMILFVLMLMNLSYVVHERVFHSQVRLGIVFGAATFCLFLFFVVFQKFSGAPSAWTFKKIAASGGSTNAIGSVLYTKYLLPFEIASIILLVAMVGAIVLPLRRQRRIENPEERIL